MDHKKPRVYSRQTIEAAILLGQHIQAERKRRGLRASDLAERAGITRVTLQKIERGDLKCELGLYFEVATIVGVPLFGHDLSGSLGSEIERINDKIALLPRSIHKKKMEVDDAF